MALFCHLRLGQFQMRFRNVALFCHLRFGQLQMRRQNMALFYHLMLGQLQMRFQNVALFCHLRLGQLQMMFRNVTFFLFHSFLPNFLRIVVEAKVLGPPHAIALLLEGSNGMLSVKNIFFS